MLVTSRFFHFPLLQGIFASIIFKFLLCFLQIPACYKHLYHKHKDFYASDVDETMKNLGVALKRMYS
jgi:hypothetical protein